ncbi:MAG: hypothetical protein Q4G69_04180 [Planctomycetia bacterium]|nr:hypothetical protein [Planctomycetia bacterium]
MRNEIILFAFICMMVEFPLSGERYSAVQIFADNTPGLSSDVPQHSTPAESSRPNLPLPSAGAADLFSYRYWMVPQDKISQWPWGQEKYYPIRGEKFERWIQELEKIKKNGDPAPASLLNTLSLEARLAGKDLVEGVGKLTLHAPVSDEEKKLPGTALGFFSFYCTNFHWEKGDKGGIELQPDGRYWLPANHSTELSFQWSKRGNIDRQGNIVFDMDLIQTPVAHLLLDIPKGYVPRTSRGIIKQIDSTDPKTVLKKWKIFPGGSKSFQLIITPPTENPNSIQKSGTHQEISCRLSLSGMEIRNHITFDPIDTPPKEITLFFDTPLQRTSVVWKTDLNQDPIITEEKTGKGISCRIRFPATALGSNELEVRAFYPFSPAHFSSVSKKISLDIPKIHLLSSKLQWRETTLRLQIVRPLIGLSFIPNNAAESYDPLFPAENNSELRLFKYFGEDARIHIEAAEQTPEIRLNSATESLFNPGEITSTTTLLAQCNRSDCNELTFPLNPGWEIDSVRSDTRGQIQWDYTGSRQNTRGLRLFLKKPLKKNKPIRFYLTARFLTGPETDLEPGRLLPIDTDSMLFGKHFLLLQADSPWRISIIDKNGVPFSDHLLPDRSLIQEYFPDFPTGTTLLLGNSTAGTRVRVEKTRANYDADVSAEMQVDGPNLTENWKMVCIPSPGFRVNRIVVSFTPDEPNTNPPEWSWNLASDTERSFQVLPLSGEEKKTLNIPAGFSSWEIRLLTSRSVPFEVSASRTRPFLKTAPIPLLILPETTADTAEIKVSSTRTEPFSVDAAKMIKIPTEAPMDDQYRMIEGAFRYRPSDLVRSDHNSRGPDLRITRPDQEKRSENEKSGKNDLSPAWGWFVRAESQYDPLGTIRNHCTYYIENRGRETCQFTLPSNMDLSSILAIWIDNQRITWTPEKENGKNIIKIQLPPQKRFVSICIEYTIQSPPLKRKQKIRPSLPEIDLPILSGTWGLWVPQEWKTEILLQKELESGASLKIFQPKEDLQTAQKKANYFLQHFGDESLLHQISGDKRKLLPESAKNPLQSNKKGSPLRSRLTASPLGDPDPELEEKGYSLDNVVQPIVSWGEVFSDPAYLSALFLPSESEGTPRVYIDRYALNQCRVLPSTRVRWSPSPTPENRAISALENAGLALILIEPDIVFVSRADSFYRREYALVSLASEKIWGLKNKSDSRKFRAMLYKNQNPDIIPAASWNVDNVGSITPWVRTSQKTWNFVSVPGWNYTEIALSSSHRGLFIVDQYILEIEKWSCLALVLLLTWSVPRFRYSVSEQTAAVRGESSAVSDPPVRKSKHPRLIPGKTPHVLLLILGFCGAVYPMIPLVWTYALTGLFYGAMISLVLYYLRCLWKYYTFAEEVPADTAVSVPQEDRSDSEPGFVPLGEKEPVPGPSSTEISPTFDKPLEITPVNNDEDNIIQKEIKNATETTVSQDGGPNKKIPSYFHTIPRKQEGNGISPFTEENNPKKEEGKIAPVLPFILCLIFSVLCVFGQEKSGTPEGKESRNNAPAEAVISPQKNEIKKGSLADRAGSDEKDPLKDSFKQKEPYRVFVPVDSQKKTVKDAYYWISDEFYNRLSNRIGSSRSVGHSWRIAEAVYEGGVNYNPSMETLSLFHIKAVFKIILDSTQATIVLPMMPILPDGGAKFDKQSILPLYEGNKEEDPAKTSAVRNKNFGGLVFEIANSTPGEHTLELTLSLPQFDQNSRTEMEIPPVPNARLELTTPPDAPIIDVLDTYGHVSRTGGKIIAELGPVSRLILEKLDRPGKLGQTSIDVEQYFQIGAKSNQTDLLARFRYRITGGKIKSLLIQNDPSYIFSGQCQCDEAEIESIEQDSGQKDHIRITFQDQVSGNITLRTNYIARKFSGIGKLRLPNIRSLQGRIIRSWIGLSSSGRTEFVDLPPSEITASAFANVWGNTDKDLKAAYDLLRSDPVSLITIRARMEPLSISEEIFFSFYPKDIQIHYQASFSTGSPLFRASFNTTGNFIPDVVKVFDGSGNLLESPEVHLDNNRFYLFFKKPLSDKNTIRIEGKARSFIDRKFELPRLSLNTEGGRNSTIRLFRDPAIYLDIDPPNTWSRLNIQGKEKSAFTPELASNLLFIGSYNLPGTAAQIPSAQAPAVKTSAAPGSSAQETKEPAPKRPAANSQASSEPISPNAKTIKKENPQIDAASNQKTSMQCGITVHRNRPKLTGTRQTYLFRRIDSQWELAIFYRINATEGEIDAFELELDDQCSDLVNIEPYLQSEQIRRGKKRFLRLIPQNLIRGEFTFQLYIPLISNTENLRFPKVSLINIVSEETQKQTPDFLKRKWDNLKISKESDSAGESAQTTKIRSGIDHFIYLPKRDHLSALPLQWDTKNLILSDMDLEEKQNPAPDSKASAASDQEKKEKAFPAAITRYSGMMAADFTEYTIADEHYTAVIDSGRSLCRVMQADHYFYIRTNGSLYGTTSIDIRPGKQNGCTLMLPQEFHVHELAVDGITKPILHTENERLSVELNPNRHSQTIELTFSGHYSPSHFSLKDFFSLALENRFSYVRLPFPRIEGIPNEKNHWIATFEIDTDRLSQKVLPCFVRQKNIDSPETYWPPHENLPYLNFDNDPAANGHWKQPADYNTIAPILIRLDYERMNDLLDTFDTDLSFFSENSTDLSRWFSRWLKKWWECENELETQVIPNQSSAPFNEEQKNAFFLRWVDEDKEKNLEPGITGPKPPAARKEFFPKREVSFYEYNDLLARLNGLVEKHDLSAIYDSFLPRKSSSLSTFAIWHMNHSENTRFLIGITNQEAERIEIVLPSKRRFFTFTLLRHLLLWSIFTLIAIFFLHSRRIRRFFFRFFPYVIFLFALFLFRYAPEKYMEGSLFIFLALLWKLIWYLRRRTIALPEKKEGH